MAWWGSLQHFTEPKEGAGSWAFPLSLAAWGSPSLSVSARTRVRVATQSRSSHFACTGAACRALGACSFPPRARRAGAGRRCLSFLALVLLVKHSPGVLARSARLRLPAASPPPPLLPALAGKASSRLPGLSLEPRLQSVTFTGFSSPYQTRSTRPDRGKGLPEVPDGGETVQSVISGKGYFQSVNLFNMPLLKVPALDGLWGRELAVPSPAWGRRRILCSPAHSCPGSGFIAVSF